MVFYPMENFKRKKMDETTFKRQLGRAVFLASLNLSFVIAIMMEIICFFIFRVDIADSSNFFLKVAIGVILCNVLIDYIYINKKRYEYITSTQYKPFNLSVAFGVTICFLIYLVSLIGFIGIPLAISALLAK
jgi:hypothetical protein